MPWLLRDMKHAVTPLRQIYFGEKLAPAAKCEVFLAIHHMNRAIEQQRMSQ